MSILAFPPLFKVQTHSLSIAQAPLIYTPHSLRKRSVLFCASKPTLKMATVKIPKRDIWTTMIKKTPVVNCFSFSKTSSSFSAFSIPTLPPSTPLQTFSESTMEENIKNAKSMVEKWDPYGSSSVKFISLFQENRKEAKGYLECIKGLRQAMHVLISEDSCSDKLVLAQNLMQISMKRLQKEFYQILSTNRKYLDPELVSRRSSCSSLSSSNYSVDEADAASDDELWQVGDSTSNVDRLSLIATSDLRSIADCMIRSGYGKECVYIYQLIRKSIVEGGLYRLGVEQYSSSQINKMSSEVSEDTIKNWLNATQMAVKTLFHSERFLCDHVFSASETVREKCFTIISKEGAINLFKFPELVAKRKRAPEKIFQLMDLYETISVLLPEIESIFSYESHSAIRLQVLSSLHKLGESVQSMLSEFESSIQKDSTNITITGGGIHPLNISVMTYLQFLANYSGVLTDIIGEATFPGELKFPMYCFDCPNIEGIPIPPVSMRLAWIIFILQCKLDSKAKLYNNIALSYICLANNLQFIVKKVRTTNLKYLLGEDWVLKHERKAKQYAANYEAIAWSKVLLCLPKNSAVAISAETVKGCIRQFNSAFKEECWKQTTWVVTDGKLQEEIRVSIAKKVVPAYRELYKIYLATLCGEKNLEVERLKPDDLGNYLSHLFNGGSLFP